MRCMPNHHNWKEEDVEEDGKGNILSAMSFFIVRAGTQRRAAECVLRSKAKRKMGERKRVC